jgi:hypothetical protein
MRRKGQALNASVIVRLISGSLEHAGVRPVAPVVARQLVKVISLGSR